MDSEAMDTEGPLDADSSSSSSDGEGRNLAQVDWQVWCVNDKKKQSPCFF